MQLILAILTTFLLSQTIVLSFYFITYNNFILNPELSRLQIINDETSRPPCLSNHPTHAENSGAAKC
jgi:hypothetical protein